MAILLLRNSELFVNRQSLIAESLNPASAHRPRDSWIRGFKDSRLVIQDPQASVFAVNPRP
jgi:hypothetical protein